VVTPDARREAVAHLRAEHAVSERRACQVLGAERSVVRYRSRRGDDAAVRARLRALAVERRRFGYRRLGFLLAREGVVLNHKKLRRLYRLEKLQVRRRGGRKRALGMRAPLVQAAGPNRRWSLDFVSDVLSDGRRFRVLCVVDDCTRECLALGGRTPGSMRLPPRSPATRPPRAGCAGGLRPALTQAVRDGVDACSRDGETALDRTEKHRHDGRDDDPGLRL
jgi:transposase InsO family protein